MKESSYQVSSKELWGVVLKASIICIGIMVLFYRSIWAIILFPIVFILLIKRERERGWEIRRNKIREEFMQGISVLNSSLQAGFSMENAWKEVEKEIKYLYGETAYFYKAIKEINQRVANNSPIEKLFLEYAYQCRVDEITQFAELLEYGKRSGSNWKKIIDKTVNQMTEQYEARQQIEVMVAEKKMEQQVMNILPLGILAFLQFSAWEYMAVLYHNVFGILCMTIFLLAYIGAIYLSEKILRIQL